MMNTDTLDREAISEALLDCLKAVELPGAQRLITISRKLRLFDQVSPEEQPAGFQAEHNETWVQVANRPPKRMLHASWFLYFAAGRDPGVTPSSYANLILNAVDAALRPKVTDPGFYDNKNTLGGLVEHAWIEGDLFKDPGDLDGQGLLIVPIRMLVP